MKTLMYITWLAAISLTVCALGFMSGCNVEDPGAKKYLVNQGFTEIELHDSSIWYCDGVGEVGTKFTAVNDKGHITEGTVCYTTGEGHLLKEE
jgi:hypothetical protein